MTDQIESDQASELETQKPHKKRSDDYKIDRETAEADFDRMIDAMDIDLEIEGLDDEDKQNIVQSRHQIVRAVRRGHLEINDKGEPIYTPQHGERNEPLHFKQAGGDALMAMDFRKKGHDVKKMYSAMATITRTNVATFSNMRMPDLKICMALTNLFLG